MLNPEFSFSWNGLFTTPFFIGQQQLSAHPFRELLPQPTMAPAEIETIAENEHGSAFEVDQFIYHGPSCHFLGLG